MTLKNPSKLNKLSTKLAHGSVDEKSQIINSLAVITKGEALGHDYWIDDAFLISVVEAINATDKGVKSRFTHPNISGDGLGKYLGRVDKAYLDGEVVKADLHISDMADKSPDGKLGEYVLGLAIADPQAFGTSIVFQSDKQAEIDFYKNHIVDGMFVSPDSANEKNLPHVVLGELFAVDLVDEPAANPDGMFHRGDGIAFNATATMDYLLSKTDVKPQEINGFDASRVKDFLSRYLSQNNLSITEIKPMDDEIKNDVESKEEVEAKDDTDTETQAGTEANDESETSALATGQQFLNEFGDKGGVWFAKGLSIADARKLQSKELAAENKQLSTKLSELESRIKAAELGETQPAELSTITPSKFANKLNKNLSAFASSVVINK